MKEYLEIKNVQIIDGFFIIDEEIDVVFTNENQKIIVRKWKI